MQFLNNETFISPSLPFFSLLITADIAMGQAEPPHGQPERSWVTDMISLGHQLEFPLVLIMVILFLAVILALVLKLKSLDTIISTPIKDGIIKGFASAGESESLRNMPTQLVSSISKELSIAFESKLELFFGGLLKVLEAKPISLVSRAGAEGSQYSTGVAVLSGPLADKLGRIQAAINRGDLSDAKTLCNEELKKELPTLDKTRFLIEKLRVHTHLKDFDEAQQIADMAKEICPNEIKADLYTNIVILESKRGNIDSAIRIGEEGLAFSPNDSRLLNETSLVIWRYAVREGKEREEVGRCETHANTALSAAVKSGDSALFLSIVNNLSYYLAVTGGRERIEKALRLTDGFQTAKVNRASYLDTRGFVLLQAFRMYNSTGDGASYRFMLEEAIAYFKDASQLNESNPIYLQHQSEALQLKNKCFPL